MNITRHFFDQNPEGVPPTDTVSTPIDFVYGTPIAFSHRLLGVVTALNNGTSKCDVRVSILDIIGLLEGATVKFTCSGKQWGVPSKGRDSKL